MLLTKRDRQPNSTGPNRRDSSSSSSVVVEDEQQYQHRERKEPQHHERIVMEIPVVHNSTHISHAPMDSRAGLSASYHQGVPQTSGADVKYSSPIRQRAISLGSVHVESKRSPVRVKPIVSAVSSHTVLSEPVNSSPASSMSASQSQTRHVLSYKLTPPPRISPHDGTTSGDGSSPGKGLQSLHARLPSTDSGIQADAGWDSLSRYRGRSFLTSSLNESGALAGGSAHSSPAKRSQGVYDVTAASATSAPPSPAKAPCVSAQSGITHIKVITSAGGQSQIKTVSGSSGNNGGHVSKIDIRKNVPASVDLSSSSNTPSTIRVEVVKPKPALLSKPLKLTPPKLSVRAVTPASGTKPLPVLTVPRKPTETPAMRTTISSLHREPPSHTVPASEDGSRASQSPLKSWNPAPPGYDGGKPAGSVSVDALKDRVSSFISCSSSTQTNTTVATSSALRQELRRPLLVDTSGMKEIPVRHVDSCTACLKLPDPPPRPCVLGCDLPRGNPADQGYPIYENVESVKSKFKDGQKGADANTKSRQEYMESIIEQSRTLLSEADGILERTPEDCRDRIVRGKLKLEERIVEGSDDTDPSEATVRIYDVRTNSMRLKGTGSHGDPSKDLPLSDLKKDVTWKERKDRIDSALSWLRTELESLRAMDSALMTQFRRCQDTIESLKSQRDAWEGCSEGDLEEEGYWDDSEISEFNRRFLDSPGSSSSQLSPISRESSTFDVSGLVVHVPTTSRLSVPRKSLTQDVEVTV